MLKHRFAATVAAACVGIVVALFLALRPGLRSQEAACLSLAQGRSLEQRPDLSDPDWGDFELPERAQPASYFQAYLQPKPGHGPFFKDVVRAALLSSAHPPAYYLLARAWLTCWRDPGLALRLFSLLCWLACIPVLARLSGRLRVEWTAPLACLVFTLSPLSWHYASAGGMATLLWLECLLLAELSFWPRQKLAWIFVSTFGLYTHEFFFLVWLAFALGLAARLEWHGPVSRQLAWPLFFFLPWIAVLPGTWNSYKANSPHTSVWPSLSASPLARAAQAVKSEFRSGDTVLVVGQPEDIVAVAASLPENCPMAGWVTRYSSLDLRWDLLPKISGSSRIFLVMANPQDGRRDVQIRLRTTAFLLEKFKFDDVDLDVFGPRAGTRFTSTP